MPTKTFFNLPEEKHDKLMRAIKQEFSRVPFSQVSVNKIIQVAQIPRGSFYQYFKNKTDVLEYILRDYRAQMRARIQQSIETHRGDIFALMSDILDFTIELGSSRDMGAFIKHLFSDMKVNSGFYIDFVRNSKSDFQETFMNRIDLEILNISDTRELKNMLEILVTITQRTAVRFFAGMYDADSVRRQYQEKLMLLKRGFLKERNICACCK